MPISERAATDDPYGLGLLARLMCEQAVADDAPFRRIAQERHEAQQAAEEAAAAAKAKREARNKGGRPRKPHRGFSRPYLRAGYKTRAEWEAAGSPGA